MNYEWVIGTYSGDNAKYVSALADMGIGYFKMGELAKGRTSEVAVAFRRPLDGPTPEHLLRITDESKIRRLEKGVCLRAGVHKNPVKDKELGYINCGICHIA